MPAEVERMYIFVQDKGYGLMSRAPQLPGSFVLGSLQVVTVSVEKLPVAIAVLSAHFCGNEMIDFRPVLYYNLLRRC